MKILILLLGFFLNQCACIPIDIPSVGMFGDYYQGDIKLNEEQQNIFVDNNSRNHSERTGWTWLGFRWPTNYNGLVIVPYTISYTQGFCTMQML